MRLNIKKMFMKIYIDNNIFIYLEQSKITINDLEDLIGNKISTVLFSDAHIQETLEIKGKDEIERDKRINERLKTITRFTSNSYISENLQNEVIELEESPFSVLETISEVPFAQNFMKNMVNFISEEQKIESQKMLEIDPQKLNNYNPSEVVSQLTKKLTQYGEDFSFLNMIEISISYHPDGHTFGRSNRIAGIFELLDFLGYWKDKVNEKSNYARLWDSRHTFYASHCDYFISNDKRTVNKAKVVYDIYEIKTKIIMPQISL